MLKQDPGANRPMNWPNASLCGQPETAAQAEMWSQAPALFADCWSTAMSVRVFVRGRFSPDRIDVFYPMGMLFVQAVGAEFPRVELDNYLKTAVQTKSQAKDAGIFEDDRLAALGIVSKNDISAFRSIAGKLLENYPSCVVVRLSSPTVATVDGSPPESSMDLLFKVARMGAVLQASARGAELLCGAVTGWTFKKAMAKQLGGEVGAGACMVVIGRKWASGQLNNKVLYSVAEGGKPLSGHILQWIAIPSSYGDGRYFFLSSDCGPKAIGTIEAFQLYQQGSNVAAPYAIASYCFSALAHELCHLYWNWQRSSNAISGTSLIAKGLVGLIGIPVDKADALLKAGQLRAMLKLYVDRAQLHNKPRPGQVDIVNNSFRAWMGSVRTQLSALIYKSDSGVGPLIDFIAQVIWGATPVADGVVEPLLESLKKELKAQNQNPGAAIVSAVDLVNGLAMFSIEIYISDAPSSARFSENWIRCSYGIGSRVGHGLLQMQVNPKAVAKGEGVFGSVVVDGKVDKMAIYLPSDGTPGSLTGGGSTQIALARPEPGKKLTL